MNRNSFFQRCLVHDHVTIHYVRAGQTREHMHQRARVIAKLLEASQVLVVEK
jgi:hypothetical protein